jgi:uncharacterized protein YkwD
MRRNVVISIILAAMSFALGTFGPKPAYSSQTGQESQQQKGSGVAGGSRVARRNSPPSSPKASRREPEPNADEAVAGVPKPRIREIEALEQQCLDEINQVRRRSGLTRLMFSEELLPVARDYSRRMAEQHFF